VSAPAAKRSTAAVTLALDSSLLHACGAAETPPRFVHVHSH